MTLSIEWMTSPQCAKDRVCFLQGIESKEITKQDFRRYLLSEHSILHSVILTVKVYDFDQFSSVHIARHKHADHYVTSGRDDWTGKARSIDDKKNHWIDINCQALIDMSRKRLCNRASEKTLRFMYKLKFELSNSTDVFMQELGRIMQPNCDYRGGHCYEGKFCCGKYPSVLQEVVMKFYIPEESTCKGNKCCKLCESCSRKSIEKNEYSILIPPGKGDKCSCYKRVKS